MSKPAWVVRVQTADEDMTLGVVYSKRKAMDVFSYCKKLIEQDPYPSETDYGEYEDYAQNTVTSFTGTFVQPVSATLPTGRTHYTVTVTKTSAYATAEHMLDFHKHRL